MTTDKQSTIDPSDTKTFESNPYATDGKKPEDIVRLFYSHDVPVIPVVSKRGLLLGILRKEVVIAELSDIARASNQKIDEFITRLCEKMTLDQVLEYGKIREFVVINLFGDVQQTWSRLQLFAACESPGEKQTAQSETDQQREDQVLEFMIYLILEHIPRPLYALNEKGNTFFYNSYFEDLYESHLNAEVDTAFVEKSMRRADSNELVQSGKKDEVVFYNKDINVYYEKVPMKHDGKTMGYLIFCDSTDKELSGLSIVGIDTEKMSFAEMLQAVERQVLVDALRKDADEVKAAKSLKLTKKKFTALMSKHAVVPPSQSRKI